MEGIGGFLEAVPRRVGRSALELSWHALRSTPLRGGAMKFRLFASALLSSGMVVIPAALPAESFDEAVTHVKVKAVLLEHFGTDALGIEIQISGGNVVLSGSVEKPLTQELAKQAALSVKGVASVENQ